MTRKLKLPNVRSMLPLMLANVMLNFGECLLKPTDPNRIQSIWVGKLFAEVDGAEEAVIPAPQVPTDGANEEGVTSTIPMSIGPRVS